MTTSSDLLPRPDGTAVARRRRGLYRFLGAFVLSVVVTLGLVGAALLAYDASYDGRVLPGVHVASVDLSGLDRQGAANALDAGYSTYGIGQVVIRTDAGDLSITYRDFSRRPDVEAMIDAAMVVGRTGTPIERALALPRLALRGLELSPQVTLNEAALATGIADGLTGLEREPIDATIAIDAGGVVTTPARPGLRFDPSTAQAAALDAVRRTDAPSEAVVETASITVPPTRDDAEVLAAKAAAERITADIIVTHDSEMWTIPAATVRGWVSFEGSADGSIGPVVDEAAIPAALEGIAKTVTRKPVSARLVVGTGGSTIAATASRDGQRLDSAGTSASIALALAGRAQGIAPAPVAVSVVAVQPKRTTQEAQAIASRMVRLSSWKTWFPISERNSWGANIWLPARFINGTVLEPGQRFEWFKAVGPITSARGFGAGGVIDGDHTDPTGAIGGGMCSSSTTLFNAALRAGLQMGARANHSYYIKRYPLGLDATVTIKNGTPTTMTFTNDLKQPILIRGYKIVGSDGRGWVRYEIWGVPDGRKVIIGKAVVTNVKKATTKTVEVTTLPKGAREQTEVPSNGMDVSVKRIVRDRDGHIFHSETYRSHYKLWGGLVKIGV